ncbi:hypothetical protein J3R82DRAFT_635 [Butyriboletus roseoflavus]|nr:hypothetical protein J3R82DRAFT_635 [Butyriboletus roseoflavus]
MYPQSPRALPREVVAEDVEATLMWTVEGHKKKGRPSKRERTKKARDSAMALEGWCEGDVLGSRPSATRERYLMERSALMDAVGRDERWETAWTRANVSVVERMGELVS